MAFSNIFKKATNFLGWGSSSLKPPPLDGEIIYCKNNVCVHPPASLTSDKDEHHQGYLTLRSHQDKGSGPTLILTWIPNSTLKKNTRSIENSPNRSNGTSPRTSPRRTPRQEYAKSDDNATTPSTSKASMSPLDSSMSVGSELGEGYYRLQKKWVPGSDNASLNSDLSLGSGEDSPDYQDKDGQRKLSGGSTGKSQTDSGIVTGTDECVQNNIKCVQKTNRDKTLGTNVNMLYTENLNKFNADLKNLTKAALEDESLSSTTESDSLTAEEKLASMLNRHKLQPRVKERTDSGRSVSIEMDGDSIRVVTEELDDDVLVDTDNLGLDERNLNRNERKFESSSSNSQSTDLEVASLSSDSTQPSPCGNHYGKMITDLQTGLSMNSSETSSGGTITNSTDTLTDRSGQDSRDSQHTTCSGNVPPHSLNLASNCAISPSANSLPTPDISVTRQRSSSGSSTTTSGPDSDPPSPYSSSPSSLTWEHGNVIDSPSSCESLSHNLMFPENALSKGSTEREKKSAKDQVCGVFSVDLGQMRSLRLFYNDQENTRGQIVIASRESQYKILHFHHGGLDKLAEIFQDWSLFAHVQPGDPEKCYRQFMIVKPQLTDDQCHPEEGIYCMVNEDIWRTHMMDDGIIEDDYQLRKAIFFGGLERSLRHEAWPFLLHYFPFASTFEEREQIRNDKYIDYQNIRKKRDMMTEEEKEVFWKSVQCTVEKDAVRTDRSHPYFKGENNPNIEVLKHILLNYAVANPSFGYTQGMSDLLSPVLAEIQNEADAYWSFEGLMQKTLFVTSPKDSDMDRQLNYLRELLRLMQPTFYEHLQHLGDDAMELLFCHRWILLCFKREFHEKDALRIWEACWSHYQTDYFHLFICVAIVSIYGEDVVEQCLPADEILLHFSSLACHMSGEVVLRKARGLLHEYRKRPVIPCTLHGLCSLCGQGMWDSGHVPTVECVGEHGDAKCPYLSLPNSPVNTAF